MILPPLGLGLQHKAQKWSNLLQVNLYKEHWPERFQLWENRWQVKCLKRQSGLLKQNSFSRPPGVRREKKTRRVLWSGNFSSPNVSSNLDISPGHKLPAQVHRWGLERRVEARGGKREKRCDPATYKLLTPWPGSWAPPWELSIKPRSNILLGRPCRRPSARAIAPGVCHSASFQRTWVEGRQRAAEDGWWRWVKLNTHTHISSPADAAERQRTSERHVDKRALSGFELWAVGWCVCLTIW